MTEKTKIEDNVILVGDKPLFTYCNAVKVVLSKHPTVLIKTRGKFISQAVNISEISKRQLGLVEIVGSMKTGSQPFTNQEGKEITVSTFEVALAKK